MHGAVKLSRATLIIQYHFYWHSAGLKEGRSVCASQRSTHCYILVSGASKINSVWCLKQCAATSYSLAWLAETDVTVLLEWLTALLEYFRNDDFWVQFCHHCCLPCYTKLPSVSRSVSLGGAYQLEIISKIISLRGNLAPSCWTSLFSYSVDMGNSISEG